MTTTEARPDSPFTLGDHIKRARLNAHLDQEDVAEACGVSRPLVSRWENSKSVPDVFELQKIVWITGAEWLADVRKLPSAWIDEAAA